MNAYTYVNGIARSFPINIRANGSVAILEVRLSGGQTIQLTVGDDGDIHLRGWGNTPIKLGNANKVAFRCSLEQEAPTHCSICFNKFEECFC